MKKTLQIIWREYYERVRKKSFIIITLLAPLLMGGLIILPTYLSTLSVEKERKIAVIDLSGKTYLPLLNALDERIKGGRKKYNLSQLSVKGDEIPSIKKTLTRDIEEGRLDAYLIIPEDITKKGEAEYYARSVSNITETRRIATALNEIVVGERLKREGLDPARINKLIEKTDLKTIKIVGGEEQKSSFLRDYMGTMIFTMILYMTLVLYGTYIMRGIVEEKSSRMVEMLLSAVNPNQLMMGKVLGIGAVGLTQYLIWGGFGFLLLKLGTGIVAPGTSLISGATLIFFIIFFILGYFLFATMYAGVGAVCNTMDEANQLQWIVLIFLLIPFLMATFAIQNPSAPVCVVLSIIPFFAPILMFMRVSTVMPPAWQVILSIGLLIAAIFLMVRLVAKVFRVGILMYGKRPRLAEIIRWFRYSR
jgi:ABC-2 type transport system permease protein